MTTENFRQAFPSTIERWNGSLENAKGMTLREYYAGLAMQGLLADQSLDWSVEEIAEAAVKNADALIAELSKGGDA